MFMLVMCQVPENPKTWPEAFWLNQTWPEPGKNFKTRPEPKIFFQTPKNPSSFVFKILVKNGYILLISNTYLSKKLYFLI